MKVKIATLLLCMAFLMPMVAQQKTDSFFNYQEVGRAINKTPVPTYHGSEVGFINMNVNATPLNGGLLSLTVVSLVYLLIRRKEVVK